MKHTRAIHVISSLRVTRGSIVHTTSSDSHARSLSTPTGIAPGRESLLQVLFGIGKLREEMQPSELKL